MNDKRIIGTWLRCSGKRDQCLLATHLRHEPGGQVAQLLGVDFGTGNGMNMSVLLRDTKGTLVPMLGREQQLLPQARAVLTRQAFACRKGRRGQGSPPPIPRSSCKHIPMATAILKSNSAG